MLEFKIQLLTLYLLLIYLSVFSYKFFIYIRTTDKPIPIEGSAEHSYWKSRYETKQQ